MTTPKPKGQQGADPQDTPRPQAPSRKKPAKPKAATGGPKQAPGNGGKDAAGDKPVLRPVEKTAATAAPPSPGPAKPKAAQPDAGDGKAGADAGSEPLAPASALASAPARPAGAAPGGQPQPTQPAQPARPAQPAQSAPADRPQVSPPVPLSKPRRRHRLVVLSFLLLVLLPCAATGWYLWTVAKDQYVSHVAFSVRNEQASSPMEILGGLTQISGSSSSDTDILYEFIQSQKLVQSIDDELDLESIWAKAGPEEDPIFSYHPPGTIEDIVDFWERMVQISYDASGGLLELRVLAFTPDDAQAIAARIYAESTEMINELSEIAREDAIRYAREDLDEAVEQLKSARTAITEFRNRYQLVDPRIDTQDQMGVVGRLQQELAAAFVELDILRDTVQDSDPRTTQMERRIRVIENRIEEERRKVGAGTGAAGGEVMAEIVGEFERLSVDLEFAQQSYTTALAGFNAARAEAGRQSRYLAAHVQPTLAQKSTYPQRFTLMGLVTGFLCLSWAVLVLVGYSLRDRR